MAADQRGQLADQLAVSADGEFSLDAVLDRGDPELIELGRRGRDRWRARHVGEGGAPPQAKGLAQPVGGRLHRIAPDQAP